MNQLVKYDDKTAKEIQAVVSECSLRNLIDLDAMTRAFKAASAVATLRSMLSDRVVDQVFMPLQGSQLGFRTDKDSGQGYPVHVVRECLISAFMHGVWATGNEFNIIAGNMYVTKNGMNRLVREFPGVSDVVKTAGVPFVKDSGALVPFIVQWKMNGETHELRCEAPREGMPFDSRIPVKVNNGMGLDAILGKAERKAMARVYARLIGTDETPDGDASDIIDGTVSRPSLTSGESRKATKSSAADTLGPPIPDKYKDLRKELDAATDPMQVAEISNKANDHDSADKLMAYGEWVLEKKKAKGQSEMFDRTQHPE